MNDRIPNEENPNETASIVGVASHGRTKSCHQLQEELKLKLDRGLALRL